VAEAAGVSASTVSRALAGNPSISPSTAKRVRRAATRLDYVPNHHARSLRTRTSGTIGLIVSDVANPFFGEVARGVEEEAQRLGYAVILCDSDAEPLREIENFRFLCQKGVDGLLVTAARSMAERSIDWRGHDVPVVYMDVSQDATGVSFVASDNRGGARVAAEHLIGMGHRRIAFLRGPANRSTLTDRFAGYRQALRGARIRPSTRLVLDCASSQEGGHEAALRLLRTQAVSAVTAVMAANDVMAFGVLAAFGEQGVKVPDDISVVGFDDVEVARVVGLTTVSQPRREMGRLGMRALLQLIHDPQSAPEATVLPTELVVRRTTSAPASRMRPCTGEENQ
jgi:LacI family transcriptional regulator